MRKIALIISALFLLFSVFSVNVFAYDTLVEDGALLFSSDELSQIDDAADNFADETGYSLAVVTTDDAQGMSAADYADEYYNNLIFNSSWSYDGLLLLIDMDNREVYISTTGECIGVFDDSTVDYIIDCGYDDLVDGDYAYCMLDMIDAAKDAAENWSGDEYYILNEEDYSFGDPEFSGGIVEFEGEIYEVTPDGDWVLTDENDYYYNNDYNYGNSNRLKISNLLTYIVVSLVIAAIAVFAVKHSYKNTGKDEGFDADDVTLKLTASNDSVISRNVITTPIPRNNNRNNHRGGTGAGSFRGGSSVHRSGGGISHGGGGRKF